ncbi:MAG: DUF4097 family beta strand repeat-containing protein [Oscillospiraceae bacterium]
MKKVLIAFACIIMVLVVGLLIVMGIGINGGLQNIALPGFWQARLANRQVFSAEEFDTLSLDYSSEKITLLPSSTGEIVLEEYMTSWDAEMLARVNQNGKTLSIQQGRRGLRLFWYGKVNLYLPQQWLGALSLANSSGSVKAEADFALQSLRVSGSSGSISLQGIQAEKEINLATSSGSIQAGRLQAGGEARLATSSGSVNIEALTAATAEAKASSGSLRFGTAEAATLLAQTSSGSIHFERLAANFTLSASSGSVRVEAGEGEGSARTTSGSVRIALAQLTGNLALEGSSGSVRLELPQSAAFNFEASTSSGSIKTSFDSALSYNQKGNQASGQVGSGPEYKVSCHATSGSVRVEWGG